MMGSPSTGGLAAGANHGRHRGRGSGIALEPVAYNPGRRRAAGIYGTIITAAILDTAGGRLSTEALVTAVVVTLLVYWLAAVRRLLGRGPRWD
jgi:hypothetical protein